MVRSRALRGLGALAALLCAGAVARCISPFHHEFPAAAAPGKPPLAAAAPPAQPMLAAAPLDSDQLDARCLTRRRELFSEPALPDVPVNRPELRVQLMGRAKAEPVVFWARPQGAAVSPLAAGLRKALESGDARAFSDVLGKLRGRPALARQVFLRDGYLYSELPELWPQLGALALSRLFDEPALQLERGAETRLVTRGDDGDYFHADGRERGQRAKLLLFDRVSVRGDPAPPSLHADLRQLQSNLGFHHLSIERITQQGWAATLHYAGFTVAAVLELRGNTAELACEAPGAAREALLRERRDSIPLLQAHSRLLSAVEEQVAEGLPFDEPRTEEGQQDGKLRPEWRLAYRSGRTSFEFNGDRYAVFDASGRPRPPQVCIDFVLDTFERASGTWWQPRGEPRARLVGGLEFDGSALDNRRSVERFIEYARVHQEAFELYELPAASRVEFRRRQRFFEQILAQGGRYRLGDIIAILGLRADDKFHYHSFIVVDVDPVSGVPTRLAANAGRPRIRTWEGEMSSAPKRSVVARVRPRPEWLALLFGHDTAGGSAARSQF